MEFYLYSKENRRLYPPSTYPLAHLLYRLSIRRRFLQQPNYVRHFKYSFVLAVILFLICTIFFQVHILIYNSLFGPFHLNLDEFTEHVEIYKNNQAWLWRKEYIQVELGENNIQSPASTYQTIRKFSDPQSRRNHIATFKNLKVPKIYVKLPTRGQKYAHTRFPFHFQRYSILTLKCIVKNLPLNLTSTDRTWIEKSEYVNYINEQYEKNSTQFNMAVLTKCGVLIGFLYRPVGERAFLPTHQHEFHASDIVLDVTKQYCSIYLLVIGELIFIWLSCKSLFYLILHVRNTIRLKLSTKFGLFLYPLDLSTDVLEELFLLGMDVPPYQQLLSLDEFIRANRSHCNNQLYIIENCYEQLFVVLLRRNMNEELNAEEQLSPFIICPVTDIRKITAIRGICYGNELSWIPWPIMLPNEQNYSDWLHEELMQISQVYRERYAFLVFTTIAVGCH